MAVRGIFRRHQTRQGGPATRFGPLLGARSTSFGLRQGTSMAGRLKRYCLGNRTIRHGGRNFQEPKRRRCFLRWLATGCVGGHGLWRTRKTGRDDFRRCPRRVNKHSPRRGDRKCLVSGFITRRSSLTGTVRPARDETGPQPIRKTQEFAVTSPGPILISHGACRAADSPASRRIRPASSGCPTFCIFFSECAWIWQRLPLLSVR